MGQRRATGAATAANHADASVAYHRAGGPSAPGSSRPGAHAGTRRAASTRHATGLGPPAPSRAPEARRWLPAFACALALAGAGVAVVSRLMERVRIDGDSMAPALRDGDRVLVNRLTLWWRPPRPGDIILAEVPIVPGGLTVKRIFAGPGETVSLLAGGAVARVGDGQIAGPFARRLGPDEYYLVGDNRAVSIDSRHFGPVDRRALVGRAWYRYASGETDG